MRRVKIFSGTSHPSLTETICERLGTTPGKCDLKKFSNGETSVDIGCSIRDQDVFIVQSGSAKWIFHRFFLSLILHQNTDCWEELFGNRANDSIMELLILISACKGGSANKITGMVVLQCNLSIQLTLFLAVMPYFPYSKQSKKKSHRGAITARSLFPYSVLPFYRRVNGNLTNTDQ